MSVIQKIKVPYAHWGLRVGRPSALSASDGAGVVPAFWGEIVTGLTDLDQSIGNLILTPIGSCPTEPLKGWDILEAIDRHPEFAIPQMVQNIGDMLTIWEPRIVVQNVNAEQIGEAQYKTGVHWRPVESVLDDLLVTEVNLGARL